MFSSSLGAKAMFAVVMVALCLSACTKKDKAESSDEPMAGSSRYKFDFSGIEEHKKIKTGEKFSFKLTLKSVSDDKVVDDIDDLKVVVALQCGDGEWEELQSGLSLIDGKVEVTGVTLQPEHAGKNCKLRAVTEIGDEKVITLFTVNAALSPPEVSVAPSKSCDSYPCVAISEAARVGKLFEVKYRTATKVSADTQVIFYLENKQGEKLAGALFHYDDTDNDNPTLSTDVQGTIKAGEDTVKFKVFTTDSAAAESPLVAEASGKLAGDGVGGKLVVKSSDKLAAAPEDALALVNAYLFFSQAPHLKLRIKNSNSDKYNVFATRKVENKIAYTGAIAFSNNIAITTIDKNSVPHAVYDDKLIIVAEDAQVAMHGVQQAQLSISPSVYSRANWGIPFSVIVAYEICSYKGKYGCSASNAAAGEIVTLIKSEGSGELLQWDKVGAITATADSNGRARFDGVFFTTVEQHLHQKSVQASVWVDGMKAKSAQAGIVVKTGTTVIDKVEWSSDDGFTFKSKRMKEGESFEYYFLKSDGSKSSGIIKSSFTADIMNDGHRLAYLIPSGSQYENLNFANTCYRKMVVKAGNYHQLITQNFGKC